MEAWCHSGFHPQLDDFLLSSCYYSIFSTGLDRNTQSQTEKRLSKNESPRDPLKVVHLQHCNTSVCHLCLTMVFSVQER